MELVYLWVEKYKNIKNQGFNFSHRFRCEYNKDRNELTIDENKEYVSIFPDNINVTAIVGENGSGKSSIAELILLAFFKSKVNSESKNWLLIFDNECDMFLILPFYIRDIYFDKINISNARLKDNSVWTSNSKHCFYIMEKEVFNLYYNPSSELISSFFLSYIDKNLQEFDASIYDIDYKPINMLNIFSFPSKNKRIIDVKRNENTYILNMFKTKRFIAENTLNSILGKVFNNDKTKFKPIKVTFKIDNELLKIKLKNDFLRKIVFQNNIKLSLTLKMLYYYFITLVISTAKIPINDKDRFKDYFFIDGKVKQYLENKYHKLKKESDGELASLSELAKVCYDSIDDFIELTRTLKLTDILRSDSEKLDIDVHELAKLIDVINQLPNIDLEKEMHNIDEIENILPVLPSFIQIEAYDYYGRNFSDFSSGEKNLIGFVYSLMYYIYFYKKKNQTFSIVLDEIEIGLHPKWQKHILYSIVNLLGCFSCNFLVTIVSHSPFILSDLSKDNIIFMENGEQKYPFENGQTFGANIHTLLAHGFFMDGGLMGEFAKGKITKILNFLNGKNKFIDLEVSIQFPFELKKNFFDKNLKPIIKIIGEDFLREKLLTMYNQKFNIKSKDDEIRELKAEIERLKNAKNKI